MEHVESPDPSRRRGLAPVSFTSVALHFPVSTVRESPSKRDTDATLLSYRKKMASRLASLIPPKIASPSAIGAPQSAARMTRVVDFYSKVRKKMNAITVGFAGGERDVGFHFAIVLRRRRGSRKGRLVKGTRWEKWTAS